MVKIIIETDNEAFDAYSGTTEVGRILNIIANDFSSGHPKTTYNDINGNKAAYVTVK